ncbi:MAG: OmpA family protein [Pseudomonadota bacterium]
MMSRSFVAALGLTLLMVACATPPPDPRIADVEQQLGSLLDKPELASRGGEEFKNAVSAVRSLSSQDYNAEELDEAIYSARRLIDIAEFSARERLAFDERKALVQERERLVLEARTREANAARSAAEKAKAEAAAAIALRESALQEAEAAAMAKAEADAARELALEQQRLAEEAALVASSDAAAARRQAETMRAEAEAARAEMESMRSRLAELEARPTERGLLLTLGDVLFAFNQADLKAGVTRTLRPLVDVLIDTPDQMVIVEGHTDAVGSRDYNLQLSQRRAVAVRSFLVNNGIASERISIEGLGPDYPVADNDTAEGRQQNRRVEVILPNVEIRGGDKDSREGESGAD